MSRIQSLDEITAQLGPPTLLRWVDTANGATAAVARFRHRGALVDINPSSNFRLIFHLSPSRIIRQDHGQSATRKAMPAGSIVASFTQQPERIRVLNAADTLQLLFSPELAETCGVNSSRPLSPRMDPALQAAAAQALVATAFDGPDSQLQQAVESIARTIGENHVVKNLATGGLAPRESRAMRELLKQRLETGISVSELSQAAGLSLHHFIKSFRQTEGVTPHALLLQMRVERAIGLLLNRKDSVEAIAVMTGFSSPSHFISTFRRIVGVTPATVRRAAAH